jgi:hypothetical protein
MSGAGPGQSDPAPLIDGALSLDHARDAQARSSPSGLGFVGAESG